MHLSIHTLHLPLLEEREVGLQMSCQSKLIIFLLLVTFDVVQTSLTFYSCAAQPPPLFRF